MRPIGYLLVLSAAAAMAAAAPQAGGGLPTKFICDRDECTCDEGNQLVTCDCSKGGSGEPLMLGKRSHAYLSDQTRSLRVHSCSQVSLVSEALSNAISLTDLELSDIAQLKLESNSLYTENGPLRRVTVQGVADLQMDPQALNQVTRLQKLEFSDLVAGQLPLDSFAAGADVLSVRLVDSVAKDVSIKLGKADTVTVANCTLNALDVDVGDVLSVTIADNTITRVGALRINVRNNAHSTDTNNVTIARNAITAMDSEDVQMTLDKFALVNNTLSSLMAPLRIEFTTAAVTGNAIGRLGPTVFDEFIRLIAVNVRLGTTPGAAEFAFTFGDNTLSAAANGSYGSFLTPADEQEHQDALYRVYGNRFVCRCEELKELVRVGEEAFLIAEEKDRENAAQEDDAAEDNDGLFQLPKVYGELYRTSKCVEGDQKLEQYRLTAYTADFECLKEVKTQEEKTVTDKENGATSAAAGVLTLLLAAATATGLAV